jgi:hypothetical protein
MTLKPESAKDITNIPSQDIGNIEHNAEFYAFEQLFFMGYAESEPVTIYKDDKHEFVVKFRTLTPNELRDVIESANKFETAGAQAITEKLETLARVIVTINHTPLVLTHKEQQEYYEKYKENPSPLTMARIILHDKIKSMEIIEIMYDKYMDFQYKINAMFEEAKKK